MAMSHSKARLTLEPEGLYGWTMYPGYWNGPYRSPIQVHSVKPLGGRKFELSFLNVLYAAGVQQMTYSLRTLRRENAYIVAEQVDDGHTTERVVIVEKLTPKWMMCCNPRFLHEAENFFDEAGSPIERLVLGMAASM